MSAIVIKFVYLTGLRQTLFTHPILKGSWDPSGRYSDIWSVTPMEVFKAEDGCDAFRASVTFPLDQKGVTFHWGVKADAPQGEGKWIIATEVKESSSRDCFRSFVLDGEWRQERYYLTHCRRLGANKVYSDANAPPGIRFSVWAPNAREVSVVMCEPEYGYVSNDGQGIVGNPKGYPLQGPSPEGIWESRMDLSPALGRFADFDHKPYMFRVVRDDGSLVYRTDLFSRCQVGHGNFDPKGQANQCSWRCLDGTKSCSNVVDPELVVRDFSKADDPAPKDWQDEGQFWSDEFRQERPMPKSLDDLVIYELHVGSLGGSRNDLLAGTFDDAMKLLPYLSDLGINAVELLPMGEFNGTNNWGYGTSHHHAIEFSSGGRDQFKHFVRECHRHGIAVIMDVVYNHFAPDADRAEWMFDSTKDENNIYYWYEGRPQDYGQSDGGYIDNQSTGFAPRYWEEMVRKLFISSAAMLMSEFHVDGFRVDQTTSIHSYAVIHANGHSADSAKAYGVKFLREWSRTLKLIRPNCFLMAEDHSGWDKVTQDTDIQGGLGFDAVWYADYYHHLIGDAQNDASRARLLWTVGFGDDRSLAMDRFSGALWASQFAKVVYHESHDEAGNSSYKVNDYTVHSARTMVTAVNGAPLVGETRQWAEARSRVMAGVTLLSAGIPMFFMGEEVAASKPYTYDNFVNNREDLPALRAGSGANMFRFYQDVIALRSAEPGLRVRNLDVLHVHNDNRVLVFRRTDPTGDFVVAMSLNNRPLDHYWVEVGRLASGVWKEILNSDAAIYGGWNTGFNGTCNSNGRGISLSLPAHGMVVLKRQ